MAVKLLKQDNKQTWRRYWYGAFDVGGKRTVFNTGVKWQGTPPASGSLRDAGDEAFEESREKAEAELAKYRDEARHKGNAAHLVERLIEDKTGRAVKHVKIAALAERWLSGSRRNAITEGHAKVTESAFERFRQFMRERNGKAVFLYEVTPEDVSAYIEELRRELAPRTARGHSAFIKSAFKRFLPVGSANPFDGQEYREKNGAGAIHRKPFTAAELQALIETANGDDMMRDLITAGACTGLRRGDVCRLRWSAVDMAAGMVTAKASKTGEPIEVPLFDPLRHVLESRAGNGSEFVFPEAAQMLAENPQGLSYRFKMIAAKALDTELIEAPPEVTPAAEIEAEGVAAIEANVVEGARRDRILEVFRRYCAGESFRDIEKAIGKPRATISADMHAVENWTGMRFVKSVRGPDMKAAVARVTRAARGQGQRAASVRDWHALRTTWVTIALSAGVPMELVRRVTGHATVDVVLKHYFRPGREEFKAALAGALPDVLTGGTVEVKALSAAEELAGLAGKLAAGSASEADRARFRVLAAGV